MAGEEERSTPRVRVSRIRLKKFSRFVYVVTIILAILLFAGFYNYSDLLTPIVSEPVWNISTETRLVLLWTPYFSQEGKWLPSPSSFKCSVSEYTVTDERSLLYRSSAVLFHWRNVDLSDLPAHRIPEQRWVLFNKEAPSHTPERILENLSGKINWTVTYRKDSDIYAPYGWVARRAYPITLSAPAANRKLVSWLVSNCDTPSRRETFVERLQQYIPVDVYGKCGNLRCPMSDALECYKFLSRRYKFYLSFENSICKDYHTEKLFYALSTDMVPVVMGGGDYSQVLPENSFIDALSFDGPRQLADYLHALDKDEDKYLSYLEWKKEYEVIDGTYKWSCGLCEKLHSNERKIHGDLRHWWYQEANCDSERV